MVTSRQLGGSEFGGVQPTRATIQPQGVDALTAGDRLRLGYLTGNENYTETLEDRRQFLGLRPANGRRPKFLLNTGQPSELEINSNFEVDLD